MEMPIWHWLHVFDAHFGRQVAKDQSWAAGKFGHAVVKMEQNKEGGAF